MKSPIQPKDLNILSKRRVKQLAKELKADSIIVIAKRGHTTEFQEHNCSDKDILFAAQNLLHELYESF